MTEPASFAVAAPLVIGARDPVALVLTNDSGRPLAVAAGKTALTMTFGDLVGGDALAAVKVSSPGWAATSVDVPAARLVLTATADDTIDAGDNRQITLDGISPAGSTRIATLTLTPQNLGAATEVQVVPAVVQATKPGPPLPVRIDVDPPHIPIQPPDGPTPPITSAVALTMTYQAPPGSKPLVDPKKPGARQFYLTAIYHDPPAASALTSKALADMHGLQARHGQVYAHTWSVTPEKSFDPPRWKVHSNSPGVLDANDSVEIVLENIVTNLAQGITSIYLQYEGMPGYGAGFVAFPVKKAPPERGVVNLQLMSPAQLHGDGEVVLAWTSYLTGDDEWLQLGFTENGHRRTLTSKAREIPLQATQFTASARLLESADFTLAAFNGETPMGAPPTVSVNVTAKPAVAQLGIVGSNPPPLDLDHPTTLSWTLTAAERCALSVDGFKGEVSLPVTTDGPMTAVLSMGAPGEGGTLVVGSFGLITLVAAQPPASITVRITASTRQGTEVVTASDATVVQLDWLPRISFAAIPSSLIAPVSPEATISPPPTTTLTWAVENAVGVVYQDNPTGRTGSQIEHPTKPTTTYRLLAVAPNWSRHPRDVVVDIRRFNVEFVQTDSTTLTVHLTIPVGGNESESGIRVDSSRIWLSSYHYEGGYHEGSAPELTRVGQHWQGSLQFSGLPAYPGGSDTWPTRELWFDYSVSGLLQLTVRNDRAMG